MADVCEGECMGCSPGDELLTLRCHSCGLPQLYEAFEGWKPICGRAYNLKSIKGKFFVFLLFYCSSFLGMVRADPAMAGRSDSVIYIYIYTPVAHIRWLNGPRFFGLGACSLFLFFFFSPLFSLNICSSSPRNAPISQVGVGGFPLCASITFFYF